RSSPLAGLCYDMPSVEVMLCLVAMPAQNPCARPVCSISHCPRAGREVPMSTQYPRQFSRRRFLGGLTLVGTAGLLSLHPRLAAAEPPPETTRIRLVYDPQICVAPQFIAEELLKVEGFTEGQYVKAAPGVAGINRVARGAAD